MKKIIKIFDVILAFAVCATMSITSYYNTILPDNITIYDDESIKFNTALKIDGENNGKIDKVSSINSSNSEYNSELKLMGIVPIKTIQVNKVNQRYVVLSGENFGIKIFTKGVMIVGMSDVDSASGSVNPAKSAGIKLGDIVLSANGTQVNSNGELSEIIKSSNGQTLKLKIIRNNKAFSVNFRCIYSIKSKCFKAGIWVRDSTAGIGTMTFYSNVNGACAGLGHAVLDVDTNMMLPINCGEVVDTKIVSIVKGKQGSAGEICGAFTSKTLGKIIKNSQNGLYGFLNDFNNNALIKVASEIDIKTGKAQIYTSIDESGPQYFDCEIENIDYNNTSQKNLLIRVTDKELLNCAGGIVQGMSGSPIIQNNQLVGAVTHVFLNDPTKGYGVFAETMLEEVEKIS